MIPMAALDLAARLRRVGVVPIVTLPAASIAAPLGQALVDGGVCCAEITLRTPEALAGLSAMRTACPDLLLGAGTVLEVGQVSDAIAAGADFIVAPGLNPEVVAACIARQVPVLPGVATPSEIDLARRLGVRTVKLFPAEALGGARTVNVLAGPFEDVALVPTGGIVPAMLPAYLAIPQILACGGSWMVSAELLAGCDFDRVRSLAAEARAIIDAAR
jgi:2-dehydro-3-deoxyphosphogluconate aldolase/(4S)-4-hydroxy-2-oxoglutarate aldolase